MAYSGISHATSCSSSGQAVGKERLGKCQAAPLLAKPVGAPHDSTTQPVETDVRRTRKAHKKVRTGCLTCKVRRKKCDETRPACDRCTSTGRRCDGYVSTADQTNTLPDRPSDHVSEGRISSFIGVPVAEPRPAFAVDEMIDRNGQDIYDTSTSYNASSTATRSHTGYSTPVSEALEDAEIEAFISGYVNEEDETFQNPSQQVILRVQPQHFDIPRAPNMLPASIRLSDLELHCFSQFRFRTGPQFASYFDSSFWRMYCTMFALSHPVVFAAATALGAVHQRYMYGISREAFEYCGHAHRLKLKAQRMLNEFRAEHENKLIERKSGFNMGVGLHDRDIIMASEMLLGLYEGFQDNHEMALVHIKRGLLHMLNRPMRLVYSETVLGSTETTFSSFVTFIGRIRQCALELYDTPIRILAHRDSEQVMPEVPQSFQDLDEARDFVFTEAEWILSTPLSIWNSEDARVAAQKFHVMRMLKWSVAYANTTSEMERTPRQKRCCVIIKLLRMALYFLLYLMTNRDLNLETEQSNMASEEVLHTLTADLAFAQTALWDAVSTRDEVLNNLARIQILGESFIDDKNIFHYIEHSVEFDSAIGPPKPNNPLIESSSKTKHLVKILSGKPIDDASLWERLGVYCVAERISAIEEHAVLEAARLLIPPDINFKWVDVTCMLEEKRILLRYCHENEAGNGTIWTQQWWEF